MNVLFANYGDFATNSTSHIAGFANALAQAGHACVVAVPWGADTVRLVPEVRFRAATYTECLESSSPFPDGRPADVIHAWTPREIVREFALRYGARSGARLVVHLEDNEDYLFSAATGLPLEDLLGFDELVVRDRLRDGLAHPRRARLFLRAAEGITTIIPTLNSFAPAGTPVLDLAPGVDFDLFRPVARHESQREALGLREGDKCIVYTGSTSFANAAEARDLYDAVHLLNQRGTRTLLVRTGADDPAFAASLPADVNAHVRHLGFVPRSELPQLLALADVLVQPGRPGPFNNFRLPSKVPEFLACGRPVIVPASNIGLELKPDRDAIVLDEATPERIADACARVFRDQALAARLGEHGALFARIRFDGARQTRRLASFYQSILAVPAAASAARLRANESELTLALRRSLEAIDSRTDLQETRATLELLLPLLQTMDRPEGNRADLARLQRERDDWRGHFEDAREHAANLAQRNTELTCELDTLKLDHAIEVDQLKQAVAQREEKIERMSRSLSWLVTMPLRALRRWVSPGASRADRPAAASDGREPQTGASEAQ